jgi:serine/threonine-protein kinase
MSSPTPHGDLRELLQATLSGAYTIERELGGGGMSRVFAATEIALDRRVVVKVLPDEMVGQVSLERFKREIALAARLQHPHIVPLLTAGAASGLPYFTMPLVEGESLRERIARHGELPLAEAMRLLREIASALSYAHERGIVHRDIKPDNVLLSGGGAMITDFGVAKALSLSSNGEGRATSMGVALGTPAYMSPEQASADPTVDHRADIYAFGVLAYELLTGQPPFAGRTPQGLLAAHVTEAPEVITRRRSAIPPALGALIMRCLEKRAADRPQTAMELVHGLDQITTPSAGSAPTAGMATIPSAEAATASPTSRRWMAVAAAVVVLASATLFATRAATANRPRSIAVLPTEMGSDTAHAYLADGLSNELTTRLSRIPGLVVRAYSSSRSMRGHSVRDAGKTLDVSSVLSAVLVRSGNRLRVTASLIDASNEAVQWSETFEQNDEDQFALQDKLVNAIAGALRLSLSPTTKAAVVTHGTRSAEAHDLVQRAQFQIDQATVTSLRSAVSFAELAIQKDSTYADAWAALAAAWGSLADDFISPREALPPLRHAVQRALALDPSSAEAHAELAIQRLYYDWDVDAARREFDAALSLDSANATANGWLPFVLAADPSLADSAANVRERGVRLNPGSITLLEFATSIDALRRLPDAARGERCKALSRMDATLGPSCEVRRLWATGDSVGAIALIRARRAAQAREPATTSGSAHANSAASLARLGDTVDARQELEAAIEKSTREYVREDAIATAYFHSGDVERSIDWWRRSVESNGSQVVWLAKAPEFAPLRKDPRVQALLIKAGILKGRE